MSVSEGGDQNIVIIMQEGGMEGLVEGQLDAPLSRPPDPQDPAITVAIGNAPYSQTSPPLILHGHPQEGTSNMDASSTNCYVCGDRASGYHYSVFSCEGCKGFFKRTVQKNLTYSCKENENCEINKYTRNSCQFCRFRKCIQMGMKKEAVREDRSPGGKHRTKRLKLDEMQVAPGLEVIQESEPRESFRDHLIEALVAARPDLCPKAESTTPASLRIDEIMQYGYTELKFIIEWAKKVPGFSDILVEDQMALLKSAFMELNVLRLSYRSMNLDNSIKFAEGLYVPLDVAQSMGWGQELIFSTMEFSLRLRDINLDHTEFCILNAIVLTYPDAVGVQNKDRVISLQTTMLDALRRYMNHMYPSDIRRYGKMLLRLPTLRIVSAKAAERFLSLTLDGSIQLNDLVLEMIN